jgi:AsnC-like ligand binding domain
MSTAVLPTTIADAINARILAISEDKLQGFQPDPIGQIARQTDLSAETVRQRIAAMLAAGTIRRVRQTLMATNLAAGALVAWRVPEEKLQDAFDWMFRNDPFSGHVVIRSTDKQTPGSVYRLWTTLKVPAQFSMDEHCELLMKKTGATAYKLMPAKRLFALGVGHVRRRDLVPGSRADCHAEMHDTNLVELSDLDWQVLITLKRDFTVEEIEQNSESFWATRAVEAGVSLETFLQVAESLNHRKVIGRFSTFLEHVKPLASGEQVTKYNALFHWAVPQGKEIQAGLEVGRHHIMTHAYWREGGPEFNHVNVMGVAHGTDKSVLLQHKTAIDEHLREAGIEFSYTAIFWGGRSEIKPSEISPTAYRQWIEQQ